MGSPQSSSLRVNSAQHSSRTHGRDGSGVISSWVFGAELLEIPDAVGPLGAGCIQRSMERHHGFMMFK